MVQHASKPFDIQSPQKIAMEYGGNKQKIAQAMQLGIVDSTAGVLAGMFIDKMRSAQMQEQAQQPTIAQQVMGGAQPSPAAGAPPAGGLGAASQGAPPMAPSAPPQGGMPPAPPMGAPPQGAPPMGMADGGLASLPIPDNMFDESDNGGYGDGYSGGGLVAFAEGGPLGPWFEETAVAAIPGINIAGRARTAERNRQVGGVSGSFHIGDNARDFTPPPGMSLTQLGDRLKQLYGPGYDVIYNTKGHYDHVHVEPGPELGRKIRGGAAPAGWERLSSPRGMPEETLAAAMPGAFRAAEEYYAANMPERKNEGLNLLAAESRRMLDPAEQKRQRDEDKWMTLAEIGFNMASSNSPYLLQAVGAAAAAALPGARAAKKEREANKREAIRNLAAVEDITYKQAADKANFVREYAGMQLGLKKEDIARQYDRWKTLTQEEGDTTRTSLQVAGGISQANISASSYANTADKQIRAAQIAANAQARKEAVDLAQKDPRWMTATQKGDTATAAAIVEEYYNRSRVSLGGGLSDLGDAGGFSAGQGRTVSQGRIVNAVPIPR